MNKRKKKIIVFGGSFNPPHLGHAALIQTAIDNLDFDKVWVIPSADRRDKKISVSGEERYTMTSLMIRDIFSHSKIPVIVTRHELDRNKPASTFDTKTELEEKHPDHEFYFFFGADVIPHIRESWVHGQEVWNKTHFIFGLRPGFGVELEKTELPPYTILLKDNTKLIDISSTDIRSSMGDAKKELISKFTSPSVAQYIFDKKLY